MSTNERNDQNEWDDETKLTAYALGELDAAERAAVEARLIDDAAAREKVEEVRAMARQLEQGFEAEVGAELAPTQRESVLHAGARSARGGSYRVAIAVAATVTLAATGLYFGSTQFETRDVDRASAERSETRKRDVLLTATLEEPKSEASKMSELGYLSSQAAPPLVAGKRGLESKQRSELSDLDSAGVPVRVPAPVDRDLAESESLVDRLGGLDKESEFHTESYAPIVENPFVRVSDDALSTFSIDVDTASYSNVRRFLNEGKAPPPSAVRIEEFINYFRYAYPQPKAGEPFSITTEVARCPWKPEHQLVLVGLQGRSISAEDRKPANLVFLIDVSGSMDSPDKLPLLVQSMLLLSEHVDHRDRVAIVVYAGASGLVLPSTSGFEQSTIRAALSQLQAGGSTNGGAGIDLAYHVAMENFIVGGTNRVILATDGDFNVGITDRGTLVSLIEEKRKSGVFLSVLGFGTGNVKDDTMELLADKGNGNYAYLDSLKEAQKVLGEQIGGTLEVIAKDVKIQVEFNPATVEAFRLIGYENRVLAHQDFADDTKDAGEIGAGHSVTALYEIVPKGIAIELPKVDPKRYQPEVERLGSSAFSGELMYVKLRHKAPDADTSELIEMPLRTSEQEFRSASENLRFAASVAGFAMLLRQSAFAGNLSFEKVAAFAQEARGFDPGNYRAEFLGLVATAGGIAELDPEIRRWLRQHGYVGVPKPRDDDKK